MDAVTAVTVVADATHPPEAILRADAPEYAGLWGRRAQYCRRRTTLRAHGLSAQVAAALLRTYKAGDANFMASCVGIPVTVRQQLDQLVLDILIDLLAFAQDLSRVERLMPLAEAGLGYNSLEHFADAALLVSWMEALPAMVRRAEAPSARALLAAPPVIHHHLAELDGR